MKKAIGGAKYEVQTERAVAGVRGTIFRVDADALVKANKGKGQARKASIVRVVEGAVNVRPSAEVAKASKAQIKKPAAPKGPRVLTYSALDADPILLEQSARLYQLQQQWGLALQQLEATLRILPEADCVVLHLAILNLYLRLETTVRLGCCD